MWKSANLYLTGLFLIITIGRAFPQENKLIRIDFPHGNRDPSGVIHAICQDYLGYIWVGQSNGLYRFNGYDFKKILTISESEYGISNSNISCIYEDSDSLLWIGTKGGGLNLYNRKTDSFTFFTSDSQNQNQKLFNDISSIYEDKYKDLWIGTDGGGLKRLDKKNFTFSHISDPENVTRSSFEKVLSIFRPSLDEIYIGTWERGLIRIELSTGRWEQMFNDLNQRPLNSRRNIWSITDIGQGKILLGTYGEGALIFDLSSHDVARLKSVTGTRVFCCRRDTDGTLYLGSESGLEIIKNDLNETIGSKEEIRTIALDCDSNLWIGQQQNTWALKKISSPFETFEYLPEGDCATVYLDNQSTMWVSYPGKLIRMNMKDQESLSIILPGKISVNMISAWTDQILVLATNEGVLFINKSDGRLLQLNGQSTDFYDFIKGNAFFCAKGSDSENWLGILGTLFYAGKYGEKFITEKTMPSFSMSHYVSCATQDTDSTVWLGTFGGGLNHLNLKTDKSDVFKQNFKTGNSLSNNFIECMEWDHTQRLWIGTNDGLNVLKDQRKGTFTTYTVKDGLPNNAINSMVFDRNGILWLGTNMGLCRLNVETEEFRIYSKEDGLPSLQFLKHSAFLTNDGTIVMGTNKGPIKFNPENILEEVDSSKILFESFQLFNIELHPEQNSVLKQNPLYLQTIKLSYKQNYFGVSFTALPFFKKENIGYTYRLEGADKDWQFTKSNSVSYTNLQPGEYNLKIRSVYGAQVSPERTLRILILPPWWKSKFAYWIYTVTVVLFLILIFYSIVHRERERARIRLQKYRAKKEQEIIDLKLAFFSQVSNELKNPLTLLMNPLNELAKISESTGPSWNAQISAMQTGVGQMKQILDQLVDFKKIGSGEHRPNLSVGNISSLLYRICSKYKIIAEKKGIIFGFAINPADFFAAFDVTLLTKIIENTLDFFLTRSFENSKLNFSSAVIIKDKLHFLSVSVSDQLGGLTEPELKTLLEPFSGTESGTPYGFGLAITNELVKLSNGIMSVENFSEGLKTEMEIPLIKNPEKASEKAKTENESGKPALLLVIANSDLRAYLSDSFGIEYNVIETDLAEKATSVFNERLPDFIICDYELNGMDGLQFYMEIIENQKTENIPVILLNNDDDPVLRLNALNAGIHSVILKPLNVEELKVIVRNYFYARRKLKKEITSDRQSIQLLDVEITNPQKEMLDRLLAFMEKNYSDPGLSVELLCSELSMSRPQLYRKLQTITGLSVQEFIKSFRLKKAAAFLRSGNVRISDVAYQTGFSDPQHFSKSFKNQFGKSPSQYLSDHGS